jgi:2,4-dienoyl-CoA reductase-like NADH-dependent reductase (Old Yellow Enzyme family)
MTSALFRPLKLADLTLQNRIIVSPMCQYSAESGVAGDWHIMHIGQFAVANPGLIMLEGTAVLPDGRISPTDLCLYNEDQENGLKRVVDFVRSHSDTKLGIQLFHSGRKGSQYRPWDHGASYGEGDTISVSQGGWTLTGPSAIRYSMEYPLPQMLDMAGMDRIKQAFVESAKRALRIGLDSVELHYAHGYLLHTFLSPVSNHRDDSYGGSLQNRMRFPLEVFSAVRDVWPHSKPLGARISGSDFGTDAEAWNIEDAVVFAKALQSLGCDYLDVSGGFLSPDQNFADVYGPAYQTKLSKRIKAETELPTITVGAITDAQQANGIIENGQADAVALARGMLYDPRWPWRAAYALKETAHFPPQYERAFAMGYPDMFATKLIPN